MKVRSGFVSNSSSTSFIVNFYDKKISTNEVKATMDRIIRAYNIADNKRLQKKRTFTIGRVTDEMIKIRCDFQREYGYNKKHEWVRLPLSSRERKLIKEQKGKIVINSVEDNSIPYLMQEMIYCILDTEKWHWG